MGKIFDALEKFGQERGSSLSGRVKNSDYEALLQFDEATGKIELADSKDAKDLQVLKRLKTYRFINDDGTLTPAGRAKYDEMLDKSKENAAAGAALTIEKLISDQKETIPPEFGNATQSDWALVMNYDRQTGNLLKYDSETGELDKTSRSVLQNSDTVQRLIENKMILPGGWLTPEAKIVCSRMVKRHRDEEVKESAIMGEAIPAEKPEHIFGPADKVSQADMEVLQDYDQQTLKLNVKNPLIKKNPEILTRFKENGLINAEGKLTATALVRIRVLAHWENEIKEKEPAQLNPGLSIGEKLQKIAEKNKPQKTSEEAGEEKLKIIPLKKDKVQDNVNDKAEDNIEAKVDAKKEEGKNFQTIDNFTMASEARTDLLNSPGDASEKRFSFGQAPAAYVRGKTDKDLITLRAPQSFEAEQFKILRTNLLFPESGKTPRSVMVTSLLPNEGKSFVAANLAVSVARHVNWNVLLIDCDLRRPSVHSHFGFKNVSGLGDYLSTGTSLSQLLFKTGINNLTILPAGKLPDNPSELLSSERMAALLAEVTARYKDRLIIIDSPPPKMTAESGALARYVDGILLVVKYGSTPINSVTEMIAKLGKNKIIGAVVNNFEVGAFRYQKKYYGGKYYAK